MLNWTKKQYETQGGPRQIRNLHYTRHDNFRASRQWITSRDRRTWREPQADKNTLRPVLNLVGPALDFRLGIYMEQRPGFAYQPITSGTAGREVAEAQQALVEYEFFRQRAWMTHLDAAYWAQTHGVAFIEVFVDKSRGPSYEDIEVIPEEDPRFAVFKDLGYELVEGGVAVPLDDSGNFMEPGVQARKVYEGELASRVVLANEILVDPEARTINGPQDAARWLIKRRARELNNVRIEIGNDDFQGDTIIDGDPNYESLDDMGAAWSRGLPPFPGARARRHKEMVWEQCIYFAPATGVMEEGSWLRMIGNKIIEESDELPGGKIPFARFTDGSSDPSFFPRPVMSDWIGDQTAINSQLQNALQSARLGGGRLLAQKNTVVEETYSKIVGSVLEYTGAKPDVIQALRMSPDTMGLLLFMIHQLENKTGWNDLARGQVTGGENTSSMQDVSGRALLGAKELFERTFGPGVRAMAQGVTEWADIVVQLSKFITTTPRLIPRVGRPDLAITLSAEKLGSDSLVYCDAQTMMPMPQSLRHQLLFDHYKQGMLTLEQYQQRSPFSDIRNMSMGDTPQWERAKWINTLIEEKYEEYATQDPMMLYAPEGLLILWQDIPGVHKRALLELILNERKSWGIRKIAADRWGIYDQLERAQADPNRMMPVPWEVIGAPSDRVRAPMMTPPTTPAAGAAGAPAVPGQSQPVMGTSPTPEMAGPTGPTAASQDTAQPLGAYGNVERAAVEPQQ